MRTTLKIPAGIISDATTHKAAGRWADGSNVRFNTGEPEVIGGWEGVTADTLTGVCRTVFPWNDNSAQLNLGFGTHSALQVWVGGGLFTITPSGLAAGEIDGTGSAGYGTGGYGVGGYGSPSTGDYFPRTWSLAAWGENLLASPRGGTIYAWTNNTASLAAALSNAPAAVNYMLVTPQRFVFALGCTVEGGSFNQACIRHSSTGNNNEWNTASNTTARQYFLPGGGRIVGGRVIGDYLLVWTTDALFLGNFVGSTTQVWRFTKVGQGCGLAGPNAAVIVGQTAFWIAPDLTFRVYSLGGAVEPLNCPISQDFTENLAASQADKIVASSNSKFNEIRFDYPDARDGFENSRYVAACIAGKDVGAWHRGIMARTAFVDAGPSTPAYPVGVTYGGNVYWHERGNSADGASFAWFIESADQLISENQNLMIRRFEPDFHHQTGAITLTLTTRYKPQGSETTSTYTIADGDEKTDVRAHGRYLKLRLSGESAPTFAHMGAPVFDVTPTGGR